MLLLASTTDSGVYRVVNELTGTLYIGSSGDVAARMRSHRGMLGRGVHDNVHLQRAWNRDGGQAFRFERLVDCPPVELTAQEQWWMDFYRAAGTPLYNLRPLAESQRGVRHSEQTRARMSAAKRQMSPETKAKIAAASRRYAQEHPDEMRARRARSAGSKGVVYSAEVRQRMSVAQKARGPVSDETRAKLKAARAGRKPGLGKKPSAETLAKRSIGLRAAWANRTPEERAEIGLKSWATRRGR